MRLPGYCETCHRFRTVRVSGAPTAVPSGICDECEEAEHEAATRRH